MANLHLNGQTNRLNPGNSPGFKNEWAQCMRPFMLVSFGYENV